MSSKWCSCQVSASELNILQDSMDVTNMAHVHSNPFNTLEMIFYIMFIPLMTILPFSSALNSLIKGKFFFRFQVTKISLPRNA